MPDTLDDELIVESSIAGIAPVAPLHGTTTMRRFPEALVNKRKKPIPVSEDVDLDIE